MKKLLLLAFLPFLLAPISGCSPAPPPYYAPPPPGVIANQAYQAGVDAARSDIYNRLPPQVDRHVRFRNPPMPPGEPVRIYQQNFRRGYEWVYHGGR